MKRRDTNSRNRQLIAYDLETTRIDAGTPAPLYITAFGELRSGPPAMLLSAAINGNLDILLRHLETALLTVENKNARFVAWNGNGFDVYFIALALIRSPDYLVKPYLTRSKSLRGLKVIHLKHKRLSWEFLDGIAMTGLAGRKLEFFLKTFAPEYQKKQAPSWETETFDASNNQHVEYAERDSEGLYYAIKKAQEITLETVGVALQPTIGNLGIKAFMRNIPHTVQVWPAPMAVNDAIKKYAMRGGYCHIAKKYHGPVWKYDLNQAYAAAMRDTLLPSGQCIHLVGDAMANCPGVVRIEAENAHGVIPFYYRDVHGKSQFSARVITETWITHSELVQLQSEKWRITVHESYYWPESFSMADYVYKLETTRINAPDGVNGATGLMIKAIGNNSYGKTVETLDGLELVMCMEKPDGFGEYMPECDDLNYIWYRINEPMMREYHQPQIGAMITAHVRMVVRRAALLNPSAWLYADTDCVMYSEPVDLNPHPKLYGRWKVECEGEIYYVIEKKVYADSRAQTKHAKGMNVNRLGILDFEHWYYGKPPVQIQIHKNNFVKVLSGEAMFKTHEKTGQRLDVHLAP